MDQRVQDRRIGREVRIVPRHLSGLRRRIRGCEADRVGGVRELLNLVHREVKDGTIIVDPEAAEHRRLTFRVEGVREPEAWLERPIERRPIVPGADVPVEVDVRRRHRVNVPRERIDDVLRRDIIGVDHVRLEVPPDPDVERQPRRRAPVVLNVGAEPGVVRVDNADPGPV